MREELLDLSRAIEAASLPTEFSSLFARVWHCKTLSFHAQETTLLDFKETYCDTFTDAYGVSIVRLALAFYNTFGGLIVFGVKDRVFTVSGVSGPFEIERFNRSVSDFTGLHIECLSKTYLVPGLDDKTLGVLLIPRRGLARPVALRQNLGKYAAGTIWVRDRHEVLEASSRHLPLLYSARTPRTIDADFTLVPIHRSLPPSPATVRDFVGRFDLLRTLWDWLIFGDQPRMYLDGPGGSGKTTLAFEFARLIAETHTEFRLANVEMLDYVVFISGKEIELNPQTGKQQPFKLRNFMTASEQLGQIAFHSGMIDASQLEATTDEQLEAVVKELFSSFNGVIVIDDIDTLSRERKDTGEESLFLKAATSSKRTRILYTLRYPPTYALKNSVIVPGLSYENEFVPFVETCCKQFGVPMPANEQLPGIYSASSGLPLIIEAIIWIRKYCGTYPDAIIEYKERGGDDARRYLYQREYDRLEIGGKSQYVLSLLYLIDGPISFSTLVNLSNYTSDQVRSALSECAGIFLVTTDAEGGGETLYQLSPPSIPFIRAKSENLAFFGQQKRIVEQFKTHGRSSTPEESAIIVNLERLLRQRRFEEVQSIESQYGRHDPVLANPRIRYLIGSAYCELGSQYRETAREYFRGAEAVGFHDVKMMRNWYHMELMSGYGLSEAERICRIMTNDASLSPRYKSEFYSKLGNCCMFAANSSAGVDREKTIRSLRSSIEAYLEAIRVGSSVQGPADLTDTLDWLEKPMWRLFNYCRDDISEFFQFIESLAEDKNDLPLPASEIVMQVILSIKAPTNKDGRARIRSFCNRMVGKIIKNAKPLSRFPGLAKLIEPLDTIRSELEKLDAKSGT